MKPNWLLLPVEAHPRNLCGLTQFEGAQVHDQELRLS